MTLQEIKNYINEYLYLEDTFIIDMLLAIAIGIHTNGEMIWIMIVGGSSTGKSELIQILGDIPSVFQVSNLTENSFLSGLRPINGKETSLLKRMGPRGVLMMKDYTSLLSMRNEKKDLIASQMREIYDGHIVKETGNGYNPEWSGKINFIGGVTDAIYSADGESAGMGRRVLFYCMPKKDRKKTLVRALKNANNADEKRVVIKEMVKTYVEELITTLPKTLPPLPDDFNEELIELADFSTLVRSPTERNFKGELTLVHEPEMGMRVIHQMILLAQLLVYMHGELTDEIKNGIRKIAFDNIPKLRRNALLYLAKYSRITAKGLAQEMNYPTETAKIWLEDLNALEVVKRKIDGMTKLDTFEMKREYRELVCKYLNIEYEGYDLLGTDETYDTEAMDQLIVDAEEKKRQEEFNLF